MENEDFRPPSRDRIPDLDRDPGLDQPGEEIRNDENAKPENPKPADRSPTPLQYLLCYKNFPGFLVPLFSSYYKLSPNSPDNLDYHNPCSQKL